MNSTAEAGLHIVVTTLKDFIGPGSVIVFWHRDPTPRPEHYAELIGDYEALGDEDRKRCEAIVDELMTPDEAEEALAYLTRKLGDSVESSSIGGVEVPIKADSTRSLLSPPVDWMSPTDYGVWSASAKDPNYPLNFELNGFWHIVGPPPHG